MVCNNHSDKDNRMDKLVKILTDMRTDIDELVGDGRTDPKFQKKVEKAMEEWIFSPEFAQTNVQSIVQNPVQSIKFKSYPEQGAVGQDSAGEKISVGRKKSPKRSLHKGVK